MHQASTMSHGAGRLAIAGTPGDAATRVDPQSAAATSQSKDRELFAWIAVAAILAMSAFAFYLLWSKANGSA